MAGLATALRQGGKRILKRGTKQTAKVNNISKMRRALFDVGNKEMTHAELKEIAKTFKMGTHGNTKNLEHRILRNRPTTITADSSMFNLKDVATKRQLNPGKMKTAPITSRGKAGTPIKRNTSMFGEGPKRRNLKKVDKKSLSKLDIEDVKNSMRRNQQKDVTEDAVRAGMTKFRNAAVGVGTTAWLVNRMSDSRGQQTNAQLYGQ